MNSNNTDLTPNNTFKKIKQTSLDSFLKNTSEITKEKKEENDFIRKTPIKQLSLSTVNTFNKNKTIYLQLNYLKASKWEYPSYISLRKYQKNISFKCIMNNTLVCLPTGMGKTLIASVTMYNFQRYFPASKCIFIAPTRPLVNQQQKAFCESMKIPLENTDICFGTISIPKRAKLWKTMEKPFIFATAHTLANDLERNLISPDQVSLIIVDEAHRANTQDNNLDYIEKETNNCYKNIFAKYIFPENPNCRIVGLSATPGNSLTSTLSLIEFLKFSNLEIRTEENLQEYSKEKIIDEIIVKKDSSDSITKCRTLIRELLKTILLRLKAKKIFWSTDPVTVKKFALVSAMKSLTNPALGVSDFALGITLVSLRDNLDNYGVKEVMENIKKNFFSEKISNSKKWLKDRPEFNELIKVLSEDISNENPKTIKTIEIVKDHYEKNKNLNSGVMIFTSLRSSADEIMNKILAVGISCDKLIGTAARSENDKGLSQKKQKELINRFKDGEIKVLIATCIGEEGLDIGEVDLIINYDSIGSVTRIIQRMGRTGRKRTGRCVSIMNTEEKTIIDNKMKYFKKLQEDLKSIQRKDSKGSNYKSRILDKLNENRNFGSCFPKEFYPNFKYFDFSSVNIMNLNEKIGIKSISKEEKNNNNQIDGISKSENYGFVSAKKMILNGKDEVNNSINEENEKKILDDLENKGDFDFF